MQWIQWIIPPLNQPDLDRSDTLLYHFPMARTSYARSARSLGPCDLKRLGNVKRRMQAASKARNTVKGYAADWRLFQLWCRAARRRALPATGETVALYL